MELQRRNENDDGHIRAPFSWKESTAEPESPGLPFDFS